MYCTKNSNVFRLTEIITALNQMQLELLLYSATIINVQMYTHLYPLENQRFINLSFPQANSADDSSTLSHWRMDGSSHRALPSLTRTFWTSCWSTLLKPLVGVLMKWVSRSLMGFSRTRVAWSSPWTSGGQKDPEWRSTEACSSRQVRKCFIHA